MKLNGKTVEIAQGTTLLQLLESEGYGSERVAVELNGSILPRAQYGETVITDDAVIEVVRFVGGG